jgi:hypothetical protein
MSTELCETLAKQHVEYLQYSGHFFAQMGDIDDCIDLPYDSSFFLANLINNRTKLPATMYIGLCLPSQCSPEQIKATMNTELAQANPIIQALFNFPLAVGNVKVNPQTEVFDYSGWFFITVILLALFFLLGVIAYVKNKLGKKNESKNTA